MIDVYIIVGHAPLGLSLDDVEIELFGSLNQKAVFKGLSASICRRSPNVALAPHFVQPTIAKGVRPTYNAGYNPILRFPKGTVGQRNMVLGATLGVKPPKNRSS